MDMMWNSIVALLTHDCFRSIVTDDIVCCVYWNGSTSEWVPGMETEIYAWREGRSDVT